MKEKQGKIGLFSGVLLFSVAFCGIISSINASENQNSANLADTEGNANLPRSAETSEKFNSPADAEKAGWSCAAVPVAGNFFRTVKLAGNPDIWENPPYLFFEKNKSAEIVHDLTSKDLVHQGDQVCVDP